MRRLPAPSLTFAALLLLVSAACTPAAPGGSVAPSDAASATTSEPPTEPAESGFTTMTEGVLTVGTDLPNPPFFLGEDIDTPDPEGFEVELVNEIASRLGIAEVDWVLFPFTSVVAAAPCPCDFFVGGVSIFPDRAEVVDFSAPYFTANQGVLVQAGTEVADREAARELQFGVQRDSSGQFFLEFDLEPTTDPLIYDTTTAAILALNAGQIDALMTDIPILLEIASENEDLVVAGQFITTEEYGAVLPKDSPNTEPLSAVIEEMEEDGFLDQLFAEWFPDNVEIRILE